VFAACTCQRRPTRQDYGLQITVTEPIGSASAQPCDGSSTIFFFHGYGGKFLVTFVNTGA
jgi:hypothetical protein